MVRSVVSAQSGSAEDLLYPLLSSRKGLRLDEMTLPWMAQERRSFAIIALLLSLVAGFHSGPRIHSTGYLGNQRVSRASKIVARINTLSLERITSRAERSKKDVASAGLKDGDESSQPRNQYNSVGSMVMSFQIPKFELGLPGGWTGKGEGSGSKVDGQNSEYEMRSTSPRPLSSSDVQFDRGPGMNATYGDGANPSSAPRSHKVAMDTNRSTDVTAQLDVSRAEALGTKASIKSNAPCLLLTD